MIKHAVMGMVLVATAVARADGPPAAKKQAVTDTHHGVKVTDDYRWLEDWNDPAVQEWSANQNKYARSILDHLPNVEGIRARVTEIMTARTVSYGSLAYRGSRLFAIKRQPPKQQPFLVVLTSPDDLASERILVDPNTMDSEGTTAIDWYVPSPDGKMVAVSLSKGGTESGDVRLLNTATGKRVYEIIPRVNGGTAGGDLAWLPDATGFFYTRYPRGDERPPADLGFYQQVYFHKLGTPTGEDRYELGKDLPRIAEIQLEMDRSSGHLLATVQKGDGGEFAHFLRSPAGDWRQFSTFGDKTLVAAFGPAEELFVLSRKGAPRGMIRHVPFSTLDVGKARTVIAEGKDSLVENFMGAPTIVATDRMLFVEYQLGGPSEIRVFDHDGKRLAGPKQLPVSAARSVMRLQGDDVLFNNRSFVDPPAWYRFRPQSGKTIRTALATKSPVDFSDVEVVREFATSQDGTKVPVNIMLPRGLKLDGSNPCVVNGYGGYGVSLAPRFRATVRVLLENGVIFAVANLRGGGEYGEEWHRQGNLTRKQNVFDDFAAALHHMIDRGYTSSPKLAIIGGSNGGLLMGATMVQHPELVRAVVSYVGIYDMLRVELSPNGAFNIPEFGTVKNPNHFKALYAYSPYHHVTEGTKYPATLFLTGANDPRVDPMQSRKMTARLQAATTVSAPILLRTSSNAGHGGDTALTERIEQTVDVYAFLFDRLGVKYRAPTRATTQ